MLNAASKFDKWGRDRSSCLLQLPKAEGCDILRPLVSLHKKRAWCSRLILMPNGEILPELMQVHFEYWRVVILVKVVLPPLRLFR